MLREFSYWCIRKGIVIPKADMIQKFSELKALRAFLDRWKIDVVLDVGANKGWYAEQLRAIGFEGTIISFEPIPEDFRIIEQKSAQDDKWFAVNKAVGDRHELKKFNIIEAGKGKETVLSSLLNSQDFEAKKVIDVEVVRLDELDLSSFCDLEAPRYFLKTDTQGYDMHVWRGVENIRSNIMALQIEMSVLPIYEEAPHYTDVLDELEAAGMNVVSMNVVRRDGRGCVIEYDCTMCRADIFE